MILAFFIVIILMLQKALKNCNKPIAYTFLSASLYPFEKQRSRTVPLQIRERNRITYI